MDRCIVFVDAGYLYAGEASSSDSARRAEFVRLDASGANQFLVDLAVTGSNWQRHSCHRARIAAGLPHYPCHRTTTARLNSRARRRARVSPPAARETTFGAGVVR